MAYVSALVVAVVCIALRSASSGPAPVDTSLMKEYDAKVCNNEPSCNLTNSPGLLPNRLTLEKRDCMCDFECVQYNDCCKDSQYFNSPPLDNVPKTIICSESRVYMITSCAPGYTDEETKGKCAKALLPLDETDFLITRPVTNTAKRLTYANAYCALCNNDEDFTLWNLKAGCGEVPAGYLASATAANAAAAPQGKIAAPESTPTTTTTSAASADKNVKVNLHFNPGSVFGGGNADGGYNKEFTVPTFGLSSKALNKTIGSQTGLFGAKIGRSKRETREELRLDFPRYARKVNEILKTVKWDPNVRDLVGKYDGKDFICRLNSSMPDALEKYTRKCVAHLISECPAGNAEASKLCQSYIQIVYDRNSKQPYRNRDCARCNGLADANLTGCPPDVRGGAAGLFSADGKGNANNAACSNPKLAAKFC